MTTAAAVIKVDGAKLSDETFSSLTDLRVVRELNETASCELRFMGPSNGLESIATSLSIDKAVEVSAVVGGKTTQVFDGLVVSVTLDLQRGGVADLIVECHDKSTFFSGLWVGEPLPDAKVEDFVKNIAGDCGLSADVESTSETFEHYMIVGTALDALDEILLRYGLCWMVSDGTLHLERPFGDATVTLDPAENLQRLRTRLNGTEQSAEVVVNGWDPNAKKPIVGSARSPGSSARSTVQAADRVEEYRTRYGGLNTDYPLLPMAVQSEGDAKSVAQAMMDRRVTSGVRGWGETSVVVPDLLPGSMVTIENVSKQWAGDYPVARVEHVLGEDRPFVTLFDIGPGELPSRIAARRSGMHHLTIGEVTNITDPDKLNRVKVKYPYFGTGQYESGWARVVQQGAGTERGLSLLPEIGDEVVIGFEQGDVNRPFVLGGLWNGVDKPPFAQNVADGKVEQRGLKSRFGHALIVTDSNNTADSGFVLQLDNKKAFVKLTEENVEINSNNKPITIKGASNSEISIDDSGNITIKGASLKIETQQKAEVEAGSELNVKTQTNLKLEAGTNLDMKGGLKSKLEGATGVDITGLKVQVN